MPVMITTETGQVDGKEYLKGRDGGKRDAVLAMEQAAAVGQPPGSAAGAGGAGGDGMCVVTEFF